MASCSINTAAGNGVREGGQERCYFLQCGNCDSLAVVVVAHRDWLATIGRADDCSVWFVASVCHKPSPKQISV